MDFDSARLYYSHQQLQVNTTNDNGGDDDNMNDEMDQREIADAVQPDEEEIHEPAVRRHFREFLRNYRISASDGNAGGSNGSNNAANTSNANSFVYRSALLRLHRRWDAAESAAPAALSIQLEHLGEYSSGLLGYVLHQPSVVLPMMERGARDALQTLLCSRNATRSSSNSNNNNNRRNRSGLEDDDDEEEGMDDENNNNNDPNDILDPAFSVQIQVQGRLTPTPLREIQSSHLHRLVRCPGIVIAASSLQHRAVQLTVRCTRCHDQQTMDASTNANSGSLPLPAQCHGPNPAECGRFPYVVAPDESVFVNGQTLKLQELPGTVPTGEMPRSVLCYLHGRLVDQAPPGTRLDLWAVPTLVTYNNNNGGGNNNGHSVSSVYLRVVGMQAEQDAHARNLQFTPAEQEAFTALAHRADVYDILQRSVAPHLRGSYTIDIKKALCCQLLGGSGKKLPDGVKLRGDINVLLLGDPSMAKSQFLKFVAQVAPVGIYTSGKGSSAAGLTASVVKDKKGEFYLEGGALVLADGGIVCIDEFDKMRPNDRVAIHEAMEQQTISVAKAGITTVLHSRAAVLAAANPVHGRYDDTREAAENIDLMTTILSRFDVIFLVRDVREEERDRLICQHVMGVHMDHVEANAGGGDQDWSADAAPEAASAASTPAAIAEHVWQIATTGQGELNVPSMKKYIQFCKARCSPRLSPAAAEVLQSSYVQIRDQVRQRTAAENSGNPVIPITVRQLEALVRISESLAKMRLDDQVQIADVTEALRLFKVSTMAANQASPDAAGVGMPEAAADRDRTEAFLRARLTVGGSLVNKQRLVEQAVAQGFHAGLVLKILSVMAGRGQVLERHQGRLLKRVQ